MLRIYLRSLVRDEAAINDLFQESMIVAGRRLDAFRMPQKRHTVDQIVAKLRKADVELGKGKKVPEVCKLLEVVTQSH